MFMSGPWPMRCCVAICLPPAFWSRESWDAIPSGWIRRASRARRSRRWRRVSATASWPLFWLLLFGLPGVWMYKAINTADSIIGHKEPRWRAFGWAAARIDDGANWIPARIAGALVCIAGAGGWAVMKRDARAHASPNAGWPEAAMAGALGVALAGPVAYDGVTQIKPWIGREGRAASPKDIVTSLQIYARACLLLWVIAGSVAWLA